MSSMKPMSSISSASSRTKNLMSDKIERLAAHVVHDAAGRADHDLGTALRGRGTGARTADRHRSEAFRLPCGGRTCGSPRRPGSPARASGQRISAWTVRCLGSICSMIGRPKAAVLPEPVWAWAMTSRLPSAAEWWRAGSESALRKPTAVMLFRSGSLMPRSAKVIGLSAGSSTATGASATCASASLVAGAAFPDFAGASPAISARLFGAAAVFDLRARLGATSSVSASSSTDADSSATGSSTGRGNLGDRLIRRHVVRTRLLAGFLRLGGVLDRRFCDDTFVRGHFSYGLVCLLLRGRLGAHCFFYYFRGFAGEIITCVPRLITRLLLSQVGVGAAFVVRRFAGVSLDVAMDGILFTRCLAL